MAVVVMRGSCVGDVEYGDNGSDEGASTCDGGGCDDGSAGDCGDWDAEESDICMEEGTVSMVVASIGKRSVQLSPVLPTGQIQL